jgi:hypothetical protein
MKSSFHRLINFLPLFCNCQFRRLDSIQFLCSQAHILADWHLETRINSCHLNSSLQLLCTDHAENNLSILGKACLQGRCMATEFTRFFLRIRWSENIFTELLPINEHLFWLRYSVFQASCDNIFSWVFPTIYLKAFHISRECYVSDTWFNDTKNIGRRVYISKGASTLLVLVLQPIHTTSKYTDPHAPKSGEQLK